MKNTILKFVFVGLLGLSMFSCTDTSTPSYVINGEISNTEMDSIYLFVLGVDGWESKDSTTMDSGRFEFSGSVQNADYFSVGNKSRSYSIRLLVSNSNITIKGDFEKPGEETITGSAAQDEFLAVKDSMSIFSNRSEFIIEEHNKASELQDTAAMKLLENEYDINDELKRKWLEKWVLANPQSIAAQLYVLNPLMYGFSFEELKSTVTNFAPETKNNGIYAVLEKRVNTLENSSIGKVAPDFTMSDTTGKMVSLSSHFGNYLLIDFWASWCGPCRADNPQMVSVYNTYHEKGYNVIGVSLDAKEDRWLQAISDDSLFWSHVSDLKGWKNEAATLYGVSSIPHTVLLNPEGIIIARGLRGDELEAKLAEVFASEVQ